MTKFRKQIVSIFATGAMLLNVALPVSATTSGSELEISGNGADSTNKISYEVESSTGISQTNEANVVNIVKSEANSGDNSASYNTGDDVSVMTGDATSKAAVTNMLNSNSAELGCCENQPVNALISGNGADSTNKIYYENEGEKEESNTEVAQKNDANVFNFVKSEAESGDNKAYKNTNGDVTIMTGDAYSKVGVSTTANNNSLVIGGPGQTGGLSAVISGNGADSYNKIKFELEKSVSVLQDNDASVKNKVYADADSGDNKASFNTGGDVFVGTGDATTLVGVDNKLNFNWAEFDCCTATWLDAKISGNGADSENKIYFDLESENYLTQENKAELKNKVDAEAETGDNKANKNTGGEVEIMTGDATNIVGIDNLLNFNYADFDCCLFDFDAKISGNGADSYNKIKVEREVENGKLQGNLAGLFNGVFGDGADTGDNKVKGNTGDVGGDPSVYTGNALAMTSIANKVNMNEDGVHTVELPGFNWEVQFIWNWAFFWSMFTL